MLEILWVSYLLKLVRLLAAVLCALITVTLLIIPGQDTCDFDLFVLENLHEDNSGHMGIVCRLMIVAQKCLALIAIALTVKFESHVALELVIVSALLVDLPQARIVEGL